MTYLFVVQYSHDMHNADNARSKFKVLSGNKIAEDYAANDFVAASRSQNEYEMR